MRNTKTKQRQGNRNRIARSIKLAKRTLKGQTKKDTLFSLFLIASNYPKIRR